MTLDVGPLLTLAWGIAAVMMVALWMVQRRTSDAGIVDFGWAAGLGVVALIYANFSDGMPARQWLIAGAVCAWAWRLAGHLLIDRVMGGVEDGRYSKLRANWSSRAQLYFFLFFQVQATWVVLFSVPALLAIRTPSDGIRPLDWLGVAVAVMAIVGESLADRQLARFRAQPANKGRTCRAGLWRYSRHPNYFFEWLHWWAYVLLAWGHPYWPMTLGGPVIMLLFLFRITGIPYTEAQALRSRGDDYRRYQETTSVFVPWFPRKEQS